MEESREAILERLSAMPAYLEEMARRLEGTDTRDQEQGGFSLVEHVWHLADLEAEGFAIRIRRIREEEAPVLADFDGAKLAAERRYRLRSLEGGLQAFARSRSGNLATLREVEATEWKRCATQEGVGPLTLEDVPRMMDEHDASHRVELEQLAARCLLRAPGGSKS